MLLVVEFRGKETAGLPPLLALFNIEIRSGILDKARYPFAVGVLKFFKLLSDELVAVASTAKFC